MSYSSDAPQNRVKNFQIQKLGSDEFSIQAYLQTSGFQSVPISATAKGPSYTLRASSQYYMFSQIESFPTAVYSADRCTFVVKFMFALPESNRFDLRLEVDVLNEDIIKLVTQTSDSASFEALKEGDTTITVSVVSADGEDTNNKVIIPVKIGPIDGVSIATSSSRTAHVGAPVRMIASPLVYGHKMTPSFCPIIFKWETKFTDLVEFSNIEVSSDTKNNFNRHIATNVVGRDVGEAEIMLKLFVLSKNSYDRKTY